MDGLVLREATEQDLSAIVDLLRDDVLGAARNPAFAEQPDAYRAAFAALDADPDNGYLVAELDGRLVAVTQLTFIRGLSHAGGLRAQVESVRVAADLRGRGVGRVLMAEVVRRAQERGCLLVQLTTDVTRTGTRAFYEAVGFRATHHGMKLRL